ncbi:DUF1800 family protein, partial [Lyngbya confervoides]|uniref:DUF1800 family protein n=1 Tax=Lyngbya confervoides TaxID=207921 RepID=UPI0019114B5C
GLGPSPWDLQRLESMGLDRYIQQQLNPQSLRNPPWLDQKLQQFSTLRQSAYQIYQTAHPRQVRLARLSAQPRQQAQTSEDRKAQRQAKVKQVLQNRAMETPAQQRAIEAQVMRPLNEAIEARILRAINSPRQLEEVMVHFWFNHFNVSSRKNFSRMWVGIYEESALRPYALGSFRQMLGATAHHPAMLYYLDNWRSKAAALNENYARELLELHTLGVDGGYSQKDVMEVARVFTGWRYVDMNPQRQARVGQTLPQYPDFLFDERVHDSGSKTVLGQTIRGSGLAEGEQVLDLLANHPATARHLSYKLAQYFVADDPPASLVNNLAQVFQSSQGNIKAVLTQLFASAEFWDARYQGQKFKTPYEYILSAARALGDRQVNSLQMAGMMRQLGMPLYGCETPDGYKNTQAAWLSPEAMMRRLSLANSLARSGPEGGGSSRTAQLEQVVGQMLSARTRTVLQSSPASLRAAAILGSPEMMMR